MTGWELDRGEEAGGGEFGVKAPGGRRRGGGGPPIPPCIIMTESASCGTLATGQTVVMLRNRLDPCTVAIWYYT